MGYLDEKGDFQFEWGRGKGIEGQPYKAEIPQGQFGPYSSGNWTLHCGSLPYWTTDVQRRAHVLVEHFELRAKAAGLFKHQKAMIGDLEQRLANVSEILEKHRQREMGELEKKRGRTSNARLQRLRSAGRYTDWARAVLQDYYFEAADDPTEMTQSWDAGQCAWRHGSFNKIFVKQLIRQVDKIGNKIYPKPAPVAAVEQPSTPETSTDGEPRSGFESEPEY